MDDDTAGSVIMISIVFITLFLLGHCCDVVKQPHIGG